MARQAKHYQPSFGCMIPARALVDPRHTGTSLRLLSAYALHDRMSLTQGKGTGCTASNKRLCGLIGCDYTTLIKLRSELKDWGYIRLEPRTGGKRLEVVRVIPDHLADPNTWPHDQAFIGFASLATWGVDPSKIGEIAKNWREKVGEVANDAPEKVGEASRETHAIPPKTNAQYIPLRGERYFPEGREYSSSEEAHLCDAPFPPDDPEEPVWRVPDAIRKGREAAEAEAIGWALDAHLPRNLETLPLGAQVSRLDKAFTAIGRDPDALRDDERAKYCAMLTDIFETCMGGDNDATAQQALRLSEDMAVW